MKSLRDRQNHLCRIVSFLEDEYDEISIQPYQVAAQKIRLTAEAPIGGVCRGIFTYFHCMGLRRAGKTVP